MLLPSKVSRELVDFKQSSRKSWALSWKAIITGSMWNSTRQYLTINHPKITKKQIHFPGSTMRRDLCPPLANRQQLVPTITTRTHHMRTTPPPFHATANGHRVSTRAAAVPDSRILRALSRRGRGGDWSRTSTNPPPPLMMACARMRCRKQAARNLKRRCFQRTCHSGGSPSLERSTAGFFFPASPHWADESDHAQSRSD